MNTIPLEYLNDHDEILPNLYIGGWPFILDGVNKFKYVFCLAANPNYRAIKNKTIVTWAPFEDIDVLPPEDFLHEIADQVVQAVSKGPTLVHCAAGLNRSGLITALTLVKMGWKSADAIQLLRDKRSIDVLFNKTFANWLLQLSQPK